MRLLVKGDPSSFPPFIVVFLRLLLADMLGNQGRHLLCMLRLLPRKRWIYEWS